MNLKVFFVVVLTCFYLTTFGQCGSGEFKERNGVITWKVSCMKSMYNSFQDATSEAFGSPNSGSNYKLKNSFGTTSITIRQSKKRATTIIKAIGSGHTFDDPKLNALVVRLNKIVKLKK